MRYEKKSIEVCLTTYRIYTLITSFHIYSHIHTFTGSFCLVVRNFFFLQTVKQKEKPKFEATQALCLYILLFGLNAAVYINPCLHLTDQDSISCSSLSLSHTHTHNFSTRSSAHNKKWFASISIVDFLWLPHLLRLSPSTVHWCHPSTSRAVNAHGAVNTATSEEAARS